MPNNYPKDWEKKTRIHLPACLIPTKNIFRLCLLKSVSPVLRSFFKPFKVWLETKGQKRTNKVKLFKKDQNCPCFFMFFLHKLPTRLWNSNSDLSIHVFIIHHAVKNVLNLAEKWNHQVIFDFSFEIFCKLNILLKLLNIQ